MSAANAATAATAATVSRSYHTIENAAFTAVYDRTIYKYENVYGFGSPEPRYGYGADYHIFAKYGDKVYMEVRGCGNIVMSFAELQKNKYWKAYYEISLLLTKDPHTVIQDIEYRSKYIGDDIYEEPRTFALNTAFIETNISSHTKKIIGNDSDDICYIRVSPYELVNMEYDTPDALATYQNLYESRRKIRNKTFEERCAAYKRLISDGL
jgi:hypothetical protein|uniref:Uncharacterized protein n=1 Tax=viral metagenome TaxID=1070528 RepID=A0A6C0CF11_9ZZZZ